MLMKKCFHISRRYFNVLGIETSCDDTAVAIVNSNRDIVFAKKYANHAIQKTIGGIQPSLIAQQHREKLPVLVKECLETASISIDAIAVTNKPGFVIALKEGVSTALMEAGRLQIPLIPVHHMRAHALSAFLVHNQLKFPFVALLVSGAHAIICLVRDVENFEVYGESVSGSPGECLDKVGRELNLNEIPEFTSVHTGVAIESLARRSSENGYKKYSIFQPHTSKCDMNFSSIKSSYLNLARKEKSKDDFCVEDFCASLQFSVTRHICTKLFTFLDHISTDQNVDIKSIVISGGVAANKYVTNAIAKIGNQFDLETLVLPPHLCTDNAEMVAYTGCLMVEKGSSEIIQPDRLPESLYVHARWPIGESMKHAISEHHPRRLSSSSVHGDFPLKIHDKRVYKK